MWDSICVDEAVQFCNAACVPVNPPLAPGDLVITEIMNNPEAVADSAGEWFELYNDSLSPIDLQGLVIRHDAVKISAVHTITQSIVLLPGDFVVLGNNADQLTNGNIKVDYAYPAAVNLSNTKDYLGIETADVPAVVIDETSWNESSGLDPKGKSRNLNPLFLSAYDNDSDSNFCEASSVIANSKDSGTPGAANDVCP